ncbi:MAG TPA: hypothetical protein VLX68_08735 [Chitinivibrionales bacterium]|nr:hypothetical protein [Chitinivibrionales bacterium]
MRLRLFKEPFPEPFSKGKTRLLFEMAADENAPGIDKKDFYLYVWIQDLKRVAGFQAVLNEEITAEYRPESPLAFTRVSKRPITRALRERLTQKERTAFLGFMKDMECPVFTHLVRRIESVIHGDPATAVELTQEETATLKDLVLLSAGKQQ